jgi:hypothetical protein
VSGIRRRVRRDRPRGHRTWRRRARAGGIVIVEVPSEPAECRDTDLVVPRLYDLLSYFRGDAVDGTQARQLLAAVGNRNS